MIELASSPGEHQHDWCSLGTVLTPLMVLDDWLGPTAAIIECKGCEQTAFCFLVAWHGRQLCERLYAIRELSKPVVETYLRNVSRDYCDLTRKQSETTALLNAAAPYTLLVLTRLPDMTVCRSTPSSDRHAFLAWQQIPEATDKDWQVLTT